MHKFGRGCPYLQLWFGLRFFQYGLHLRRFHDIALDLQLSGHE